MKDTMLLAPDEKKRKYRDRVCCISCSLIVRSSDTISPGKIKANHDT